MRPAAVLIAIVFGSASAISFGLIATAVVFLFVQSDQPSIAREFRPLLISCLWFVALAGAAGSALYSTLKELAWRRYAQIGMAIVMIGVALAYWPRT